MLRIARRAAQKQELLKVQINLIEAIAGKETAEKLTSEQFFNDHIAADKGEPVDGKQLDGILAGCVILGVEPVNYPFTDGLYIYVKRPGSGVYAIVIDAPDYEPLEITRKDIDRYV